ncbi:HAUS augmin-like complex subunit 6 [Silurus meridionalis]|nr:HAUS augmin-like complex subunit 6 [Silurus meridionalis]
MDSSCGGARNGGGENACNTTGCVGAVGTLGTYPGFVYRNTLAMPGANSRRDGAMDRACRSLILFREEIAKRKVVLTDRYLRATSAKGLKGGSDRATNTTAKSDTGTLGRIPGLSLRKARRKRVTRGCLPSDWVTYALMVDTYMFDKPNKEASYLVIHFLFKKLNPSRVQDVFRHCWPVLDHKADAEFRKVTFGWLQEIANEKGSSFPKVIASHLHSSCGPRFINIMLHLAKYVMLKMLKTFSTDGTWVPEAAAVSASSQEMEMKRFQMVKRRFQSVCLEQDALIQGYQKRARNLEKSLKDHKAEDAKYDDLLNNHESFSTRFDTNLRCAIGEGAALVRPHPSPFANGSAHQGGLNPPPGYARPTEDPRRCGIVTFRRDSDLEAFSHNPTDGSFAPVAPQPSTRTKCRNLRFHSY